VRLQGVHMGCRGCTEDGPKRQTARYGPCAGFTARDDSGPGASSEAGAPGLLLSIGMILDSLPNLPGGGQRLQASTEHAPSRIEEALARARSRVTFPARFRMMRHARALRHRRTGPCATDRAAHVLAVEFHGPMRPIENIDRDHRRAGHVHRGTGRDGSGPARSTGSATRPARRGLRCEGGREHLQRRCGLHPGGPIRAVRAAGGPLEPPVASEQSSSLGPRIRIGLARRPRTAHASARPGGSSPRA
jgi:hypothetical protein